jgi:hypothetical protein
MRHRLARLSNSSIATAELKKNEPLLLLGQNRFGQRRRSRALR